MEWRYDDASSVWVLVDPVAAGLVVEDEPVTW
jgi:hypothetical protein